MCLVLPGTHGSPITCILVLTTQFGAKPVASTVPNAPCRMQSEIFAVYNLSIKQVRGIPAVVSPFLFTYCNAQTCILSLQIFV